MLIYRTGVRIERSDTVAPRFLLSVVALGGPFARATSASPAPLLQAGGSLAEVCAVAFPDQGALEGEDLAHHPTGLVAVVDDQGVDPDVEGEYLEVEVRDEADALGPVLAQGFLAAEHAVAAEDADR